MDDKFLSAVKKYYHTVEEACELLIKKLENEEQIVLLNKYGLYEYLREKHMRELSFDNRKYYFHGAGCTVFMNGASLIEWDFGYRSWWCGIDPFKMANTLKNFSFEGCEFYDGTYVKGLCEEYAGEGFLYYYRGQYYVDLLKISSIQMRFPLDYDCMVAEYKGHKRFFLRSKNLDRFIRKSAAVYAGIHNLPNNYTLIFYKQNSEIIRIPYNDLAFPPNAVKIMNDEILKPSEVDLWI